MGKYLVLYQIGGAGDPVIYRRGAVIEVPRDMEQARADIHVVHGNLRPVDGTPEPAVPPEAPVIFEAAPEEAPVAELEKPARKGKGD